MCSNSGGGGGDMVEDTCECCGDLVFLTVSVEPYSHCIIKPVSPVSVMGSMCPHNTRFHPNRFHLVSPETCRRVGFKRLRFIEHTCGFIADVRYYEFIY